MKIATYRRAIKSAIRKVASHVRNWSTPERRKVMKAMIFFLAVIVVRSLLSETKPTSTIGTALTLLPDLLYAIC